jgi:hypothetical protein
VGETGGLLLTESLDEQAFDLATRILNYAIEFVNTGGYASLRFTDVLGSYLEIILRVDQITRKEFYMDVKKMIEDRDLLAPIEEKERFLDQLMSMFVAEWREESTR